MAGNPDAFSAGASEHQSAGTRSAGVPEAPTVQVPKYGPTKNSGQDLEAAAEHPEEGMRLHTNEAVRKMNAAKGHSEARHKDYSVVGRQVRKAAAARSQQPIKPKELRVKANEIAQQLSGHLRELEAAFPDHPSVTPFVTSARAHHAQAIAHLGSAADHFSKLNDLQGQKHVAMAYQHLEDAQNDLYEHDLLNTSGVPLSPVSSTELYRHGAHAKAIASAPQMNLRTQGKAPKSLKIGEVTVNAREKGGKEFLGAMIKEGSERGATAAVSNIKERVKGTPRVGKTERKVREEAGLPANAKVVSSPAATDGKRPNSPKIEVYQHPNARRVTPDVALGHANVNLTKNPELSQKNIEAAAPTARVNMDDASITTNPREVVAEPTNRPAKPTPASVKGGFGPKKVGGRGIGYSESEAKDVEPEKALLPEEAVKRQAARDLAAESPLVTAAKKAANKPKRKR